MITLNNNALQTFILDNRCAAVSAVSTQENIAATDGKECEIHIINGENACNRRINTLRAYRKLRAHGNCGYTALACCDRAEMYILDSDFREVDSLILDTTEPCACGGICEGDNNLNDASFTVIESEKFIVAAFDKNVYLYDLCGQRQSLLCTADRNEIITDFISPYQGLYAMSTVKAGIRTVTVSDGSDTHSAILGQGHTLRMLIDGGNGNIHGLFGKNYIYNKILPIYENGVFGLPSTRSCNR